MAICGKSSDRGIGWEISRNSEPSEDLRLLPALQDAGKHRDPSFTPDSVQMMKTAHQVLFEVALCSSV